MHGSGKGAFSTGRQTPHAFGHYGFGGSGGWADPDLGLSLGFVTNRIGSLTTPMADLTEAGDTFHTNAMIDNVLIARAASCDTRARLYANGHDLKDPLLSPVYGDLRGFPPTMLMSGTRDLLLSNTVRMHRKLRQAGVESVLEVFEGQLHGAWYRDANVPESKDAFEEIARFFDKHLGK